MNLKENTILVTGGGSGIGLGLAKKFVQLGNKVIIIGRNQEKLNLAKKECMELITYQCDISKSKQLADLSTKIISEHPNLNVLINNAGILVSRNLLNSPESLEELTREVDINVKGTVLTTSLFLNQIKKKKGSIINVSSGLGFAPMMSAPIYCGTKAFIHSFSITLRLQMERHGVEVFELAPPAVQTNMTVRMPKDGFFDILPLDELVKAAIKGLKKGKQEILPGQSRMFRLMSRIAPSYIERRLAKASKGFMPKLK